MPAETVPSSPAATPPPAKIAGLPTLGRKLLWLPMLVCCLVAAGHWWIISAGFNAPWPRYGSAEGYYSSLAAGFQQGQLAIAQSPDPQLLALSDPYDHRANKKLRLHDALLYEGRYYLPWGPMPAILSLPSLWLAGKAWHDNLLVYLFTTGCCCSAIWLLTMVRQRLYPGRSAAVIALGGLLVGCSYPITFSLARASAYEASIAAGQCFLMLAICCLFRGFATHPTRTGWLWGAGLSLGASLASRISMLFPIAAMLLLALLFVVRRAGPPWRNRGWHPLAALFLPVIVSGGLLGLYNERRFGSPTEFGLKYQLGGWHAPTHVPYLFRLRHAPMNLYSYWLQPAEQISHFPWLMADRAEAMQPREIVIQDLTGEPVMGLLAGAPFILFALAMATKLRGVFRAEPSGDLVLESWLTWTLSLSAVLGLLVPYFMISATMRYLFDCSPCWLTLATLGVWNRPAAIPLRYWVLLLVPLALVTLGVGGLLSFTGPLGHFEYHNPRLYQQLDGQSYHLFDAR